jgi:hypothetical protein
MVGWLSIFVMSAACGGTTAAGVTEDERDENERVDLTDDPERARAFQAPLDIFVGPLDRGLADVSAGAEPAEAFGEDIIVTNPESFATLGARDGAQLEVGELELVIVTVKDRGPPDSERWQQARLEVTAVRAGGVFRLTALHSEQRQLADEPEALDVPPTAWSELRDALIDSFGGPSCRFLPRLRRADLEGVFDESTAQELGAAMPDQDRIDRTCGEWWDRTPPYRTLSVSRARIHHIDRDRRVLARLNVALGYEGDALTFGSVSIAER